MIETIIKEAYKLKWTEDNNPNGWIEPTTYCQLKCAGCYRDCNRPGQIPAHLPLEEMKKQVDWFITHRNVQTISIAGGEPLMYPHLEELITYISSKKCRTMIYTNGLLLDKERIKLLEEAGATQMMVHIDEYQGRPDIASIEDIPALREQFCILFKDFKKIKLGFIQPISADNLQSVSTIMHIAHKHIDVVSLLVFTIYRNVCKAQTENPSIPAEIGIPEIINTINTTEHFIPAAYLTSSQNTEDIAWLFGIRAGTVKKIFGYFGPDLYRYSHEKYYALNKRFLFISQRNNLKISSLFAVIHLKSVRQVLISFFKNLFTIGKKGTFFQTILILRGVEERNGTWDECDACPDRMIYNGKLIPSCILENLKEADLSAYKNVSL